MTPKKITAWSISRLNTYEQCPRLAKYKFVDRLKEPGSAAMDRGTALHEAAERYLLKGGRVPKGLSPIADQLKDLRRRKATAEAEFTFTKTWEPTRWNDWDGAWVRMKADAVVLEAEAVHIYDFKSGGKSDGKGSVQDAAKYDDQLELYGVAGLCSYPQVKEARGGLLFIDHGVEVASGEPLTPADLPKLKKKWVLRVKPMFADSKFKPRPGNYCRWCHFRRENGGPCEF